MQPNETERDPRWAAVRRRDASADGTFFYAVRTTGVYCRPSCAARPARPENVTFYATAGEAERAGYRACKRCKPGEPALAERRAAIVAELCRLIDASEEPPSLEALAAHAKLSPFHLHRVFKAATGVTPKAYAAARRAARLTGELRAQDSVVAAIYGAGFGSSARFYAEAPQRLGMTPSTFRAGGVDEEIEYAIGTSTLGPVLVAATGRGVCAILFGESREALAEELAARFPRARLSPGTAAFEATVAAVLSLIEQPDRASTLPLDIRGTAFQERVWRALLKVPAGETVTYAELAAAIGAPRAARAVAQACANNPIAVAVPCHRVVGKDGALTGYRWGTARKQALLGRESKSGEPSAAARRERARVRGA